MSLTHDFIEPDRLHACILKLREGTPGLHSLMLPTVAYQQYAVVRMKPVHKFIHLTGRCQRRFVEDIEPLLSGVWLLSPRQMLLERGCFHARFGEFLCRSGRGSETLHSVSVGFRAFADNGQCRRLSGTRNAIQTHDFLAW